MELSQTRVKKIAEDEFRTVCEVFGFDSVNKHQEEALRFVFESKSHDFVPESSAGVGKSVVFQALPIEYSCVDPTREKNIVLRCHVDVLVVSR